MSARVRSLDLGKYQQGLRSIYFHIGSDNLKDMTAKLLDEVEIQQNLLPHALHALQGKVL